jgi:hypothetical protein
MWVGYYGYSLKTEQRGFILCFIDFYKNKEELENIFSKPKSMEMMKIKQNYTFLFSYIKK